MAFLRTVRIEAKGEEEAKESLKHIKRVHGRALEAGLHRVAKVARRELVKAIRKGAAPKPRKGTILRRKKGKLAGYGGDAVPTFSSRKALYRSKEMAKALTYGKMRRFAWAVGIPNGIMPKYSSMSGLRTLDVVAAMQECGFSKTIPLTARMRAYLLILYGRIFPKGTGPQIDDAQNKPVGSITVGFPARPIWRETFDAIQAELLEVFLNRFCTMVDRRMKATETERYEPGPAGEA